MPHLVATKWNWSVSCEGVSAEEVAEEGFAERAAVNIGVIEEGVAGLEGGKVALGGRIWAFGIIDGGRDGPSRRPRITP